MNFSKLGNTSLHLNSIHDKASNEELETNMIMSKSSPTLDMNEAYNWHQQMELEDIDESLPKQGLKDRLLKDTKLPNISSSNKNSNSSSSSTQGRIATGRETLKNATSQVCFIFFWF